MNEHNNRHRKGGRPKVDDFNKKSKIISIRLTEVEQAKIEAKAKMASRTVRDFVRESALNGEVKAKISVEQFAEIKKIHLIGNNINQLAKLTHQHGYIDETYTTFRVLTDKLNDCITRLITS